jgi:hypothetical protein
MSESQGSSSNDSDIDNNDSNRSDDASAVSELKLYRAFIFSVPIFFTLILLFLFYVFYLRPRRVDWSSIRMRSVSVLQLNHNNAISTVSTSYISYLYFSCSVRFVLFLYLYMQQRFSAKSLK